MLSALNGIIMITSVHNPKIQAVRKLQSHIRERRAAQAFIVEGVRLAEEALQADWTAKQVFFTPGLGEHGRTLVEDFRGRGALVEEVSEAVMDAMSETETSQGLLVLVNQQTLPMTPRPDFLLILDSLRDPGNLGTMLRTAAAAGVQGVLLGPGCVDAWSGKVLRAGMGAHFHLPIHSLDWPEIDKLVKNPSCILQVYLADAKDGVPYTSADFGRPLALLVGGEAAGTGAEANRLADQRVHIPMPGGSESLNAGIAASILLFEVVRQRGILLPS